MDIAWRRVAATPRLRRGYIRGDESRRRRGCDADTSEETSRGDAAIPWRRASRRRYRDAERACAHLGSSLPRSPSTIALLYESFLDTTRSPGDAWLGPRRRGAAAAFQWPGGDYVDEAGALWADGPPAASDEDSCVYVVGGSGGLWAATKCTDAKVTRCQSPPDWQHPVHLSIFFLVLGIAVTTLWRANALWRSEFGEAYAALTAFLVSTAVTLFFFGATMYTPGVEISISARRSPFALILTALDCGHRPRSNAGEANANERDLECLAGTRSIVGDSASR